MCHGCDTEILPEHPHFGNPAATNPAHFQGDAALHLHIHGGHGEFFDTLNGDHDLIFCHDCGHRIFGLFPALVERFRGAHSLRKGVPLVNAMCWTFDRFPDGALQIVYGDGVRDERRSQ